MFESIVPLLYKFIRLFYNDKNKEIMLNLKNKIKNLRERRALKLLKKLDMDKDKLVFNINDIFFEIKNGQLVVNMRLIYNNYNNVITDITIGKINLLIPTLNINESINETFILNQNRNLIPEIDYLKYKINLSDEPKQKLEELSFKDIENFFPVDYKTNYNYSKIPFRITISLFTNGSLLKSITEDKNLKLT